MGPERKYPFQYARPYRTLGQEFKDVKSSVIPRFGNSPRVVYQKLTDKCQYDCIYCDANEIKGQDLSTAQVRKIQENLADVGIQLLNMSGGEATLRSDLPEIITHASELGMKTILCTNGGVDKDEDDWEELAEAGLTGVIFSYDGIGPKADEKVIHFADIAHKLRMYSEVRMVVTEGNLDKVFKTGESCMDNDIFFQALPAIAMGGETSASEKDFTPLDLNGRKELVEIISRLSKVRGPFAKFLRVSPSYIKEIMTSPNPNSWHCKNPGKHWISIDAQGKIRVCNERTLSKTYLLTGEENPLKTKEIYRDINRESEDCPGCPWYCHWDGNRGQLQRARENVRFGGTIFALT